MLTFIHIATSTGCNSLYLSRKVVDLCLCLSPVVESFSSKVLTTLWQSSPLFFDEDYQRVVKMLNKRFSITGDSLKKYASTVTFN